MALSDIDKGLHTMRAIKNKKIKVGAWVLVSFATKTAVTHFVGQIIDFTNGEPVVKFAKKKLEGDNIFVWPQTEDIVTLSSLETL